MKNIFTIALFIFSSILFAIETENLPVKVVTVNKPVQFEFKEESIKDGYMWTIDTRNKKEIKVNSKNITQKEVDTFNTTFTKAGSYLVVFKYAKNKDKVLKIYNQPVHVLENVNLKWYDYEEALVKAKKEKKTIMLFFTGSNWCGACQSLDKWTFHTKQFEDYANKNLILVELDFPKNKEKDEVIYSDKNLSIAKTYSFNYKFPTCIFITPNKEIKGTIVGNTEDKWMSEMKKIVGK